VDGSVRRGKRCHVKKEEREGRMTEYKVIAKVIVNRPLSRYYLILLLQAAIPGGTYWPGWLANG
jgi:hypothetical protein